MARFPGLHGKVDKNAKRPRHVKITEDDDDISSTKDLYEILSEIREMDVVVNMAIITSGLLCR